MLFESGVAANIVGGANGRGGTDNVPLIGVTGQSLGFNSSWGPGEYRSHNYNWREVLNWVHGAHTLKFGANGTHAVEFGDFTPVNVRPNLQFNNLLTLVEDQPYSETVGAYNPLTGQAGKVLFSGQTNPWGLFVQDDWKAKPNLSFTLSPRWDDLSNISPSGSAGQSGVSSNHPGPGKYHSAAETCARQCPGRHLRPFAKRRCPSGCSDGNWSTASCRACSNSSAGNALVHAIAKCRVHCFRARGSG